MNDSNKLYLKHKEVARMNHECDYKIDEETKEAYLSQINQCKCCGKPDVSRDERNLGQAIIKLEYDGAEDVIQYYMYCDDCKREGRLI